jgi:hypothetical protein
LVDGGGRDWVVSDGGDLDGDLYGALSLIAGLWNADSLQYLLLAWLALAGYASACSGSGDALKGIWRYFNIPTPDAQRAAD